MRDLLRLIWLTDMHFDFVNGSIIDDFLSEVQFLRPDAILFTGDIAHARDLEESLTTIQQRVVRPFFFVLGNHDFYLDSIRAVRDRMSRLCQRDSEMVYLTQSDPIELTRHIGLIGHDGWADGRFGDYRRSVVRMHDFSMIDELKGKDKEQRWSVLKSLGDEAAEHVRQVLAKAMQRFKIVYLLTHVPPFREACWHEGRISDDDWAPHFTCKAVGDVVLEVMRHHADKRLIVLCGHTHGSGVAQPAENIRVLTGGATYGYPAIAGVFNLDVDHPGLDK